LNISNVEDSLRNLAASSTHPDGSLRLHYIEIGKTIAQDLIDHDLPINVDNVLSRLNEFIKSDAGEIRKGENEMDSMSENESFQKFKPSYTDAEIIRMKSDVEHAETEVSRLKSDVNSWESKVSLNDTKEKRANGDYAHAVSKLNEAKSRYNHAVDELKNAKRKLNSAL
jgi:chromosome segregation ATPase